MPFEYDLEAPKSRGRGRRRGLDRETTTDERTARGLLLLREKLAEQVPKRTVNETLLLASWNIRDFDASKYGFRSEEAMYYIAEIISHNADLEALKRLLKILGSWWKFIFTDVTAGSAGNRERGAFIYDSRKVKFGGLAGEVVIPAKRLPDRTVDPQRQLARTPFICGFESGYLQFMLCSVHIYYGQSTAVDPTRLEEIEVLSEFLVNRVEDKNAWAKNLVLLGDFNIFDTGDPTFQAIVDAGFFIPPQFKDVTSNAAGGKHFDQLAFVSRAYDQDVVQERLQTAKAGVFDFFQYVYTDTDEASYVSEMGPAYETKSNGDPRDDRAKRNYYRQWRTHQMSDHFPMWLELEIDFGIPYLRSVAGEKG
jgi:hypothetical protein